MENILYRSRNLDLKYSGAGRTALFERGRMKCNSGSGVKYDPVRETEEVFSPIECSVPTLLFYEYAIILS